MIRFGERLAIFFLRPLYRGVVERPLWWFIARIKAFFLAEVGPQLESIGRQLDQGRHATAGVEHRLHLIEQRLAEIDRNNAAQWDALEQLLLALYRQPEIRVTESKAEPDWRMHNQSNAHAAGHLR